MKEKDIRLKINHLLRELGYWPITQTDAIKCSKCGTLFYPKKGRPDMLCLHPSAPSIVVETKALGVQTSQVGSLSFSHITDEQREWLDRWALDGGLGLIGVGVIDKSGSRDKLLNLYLVPWQTWLAWEERVEPHQKSWPYTQYKGMRKALRWVTMDVCLTGWDVSDGIPEHHPAYQATIN